MVAVQQTVNWSRLLNGQVYCNTRPRRPLRWKLLRSAGSGLWRQCRLGQLLAARQPRQLEGPRRGHVQRPRRRRAGRRRQDQVRAALCPTALCRPALGRDRRAGRNSTITLERDASLGIQYAGVNSSTAKASWLARSSALRRYPSSAATRSASRKARPTNSTWRATSAAAISIKPVVFESQDLMYEAFRRPLRCHDP